MVFIIPYMSTVQILCPMHKYKMAEVAHDIILILSLSSLNYSALHSYITEHNTWEDLVVYNQSMHMHQSFICLHLLSLLCNSQSFVPYGTLSNVISFHVQSHCAWSCNISDSMFADPPVISHYVTINLLLCSYSCVYIYIYIYTYIYTCMAHIKNSCELLLISVGMYSDLHCDICVLNCIYL